VRLELPLVYDYGQAYLRDAASEPIDYLGALDDATTNGSSVGVADDLVDLLMPTQWNFEASLVLELVDETPAPDLDEWDHVVEFSLPLPSGRLVLEGSGGSSEREVDLPPGVYRARWSGRGFPPRGEYVPGEVREEAYRLQLWRTPEQEPPRELKRWPGYDDLHGPTE
jgi:hypothetical protein